MSDRVPPPPLSSAAQDLLRAFRDDESPTERQRRGSLASVQERIEQAPAAANGGFYARAIAVTVMIAAAVLLVVKVVGVGVSALTEDMREPAMEAPYQGGGSAGEGQAIERTPAVAPPRRAVRAPAERAVVIEPEVEAAAAAPELVSELPRPAARPRPSAPAKAAPPAEDIQAELALIKKARDAEQQGRHAAGLAALAEHARRFPQGTLADERRVMKAELLCASGRTADARVQVRRFLKQRAGSALAGRMSAVCSDQRD